MITTENAQSIHESFQENGYYHARQVFDKQELEELQEDFDRVVAQLQNSGENINARWMGDATDALDKANDTVVIHTHNIQKFSAAWSRALFHKKMLDVVEKILGPDIVLHHTKLFQKPPENGAPFPIHQDWPYFPTVRDSMIAGIVHVSDATEEMGCLRVYPGSHRLGRIENANGVKDCPELAKYPLEDATPVPAEPGDVVFFHYFTLHGFFAEPLATHPQNCARPVLRRRR